MEPDGGAARPWRYQPEPLGPQLRELRHSTVRVVPVPSILAARVPPLCAHAGGAVCRRPPVASSGCAPRGGRVLCTRTVDPPPVPLGVWAISVRPVRLGVVVIGCPPVVLSVWVIGRQPAPEGVGSRARARSRAPLAVQAPAPAVALPGVDRRWRAPPAVPAPFPAVQGTPGGGRSSTHGMGRISSMATHSRVTAASTVLAADTSGGRRPTA